MEIPKDLFKAQRVLSTHMGNTYPNHKGHYYYSNHTLYHIGTLDPLGGGLSKTLSRSKLDNPQFRETRSTFPW